MKSENSDFNEEAGNPIYVLPIDGISGSKGDVA